MRIIQIFWSKPAFDLMSVRYNGGWLERKYYYMSLCLSCLLLKRWFAEVELITDECGKRLLIDVLHLPYTSVKVELNTFDSYHRDLRLFVKLSCFESQKSPFIYVDSDVFFCDPLDERKASAPLIVKEEVDFEPATLHGFLENVGRQEKGYDLSVLGGCDTSFISAFAHESLAFLNKNIQYLNDNIDFEIRDTSMFFYTAHPFDQVNSMIESYFLTAFARSHGRRVECINGPAGSVNARENDLLGVRAGMGMIHIVHGDKRKLQVCYQLEYQLEKQFPAYYDAILSGLRDFRI